MIWLSTAVVKKLLNNISCTYHTNHHHHLSHLNHKTWATHRPHFQKVAVHAIWLVPLDVASFKPVEVWLCTWSEVLQSPGAAINRWNGLVVVYCIKIGGNEQLIYTLFNREFSAWGGGGGCHKKACKVQGEGHFYEHPKNGEGQNILYYCRRGFLRPSPPPKKWMLPKCECGPWGWSASLRQSQRWFSKWQ